MDLQPNKEDAIVLPITNTRIAASEWNQLVGSCMAFITEAGLTPDALDNEQFLNAFKIVAANLELIGANTNLSNLTATGEAKFNAKADTDLSNISANIDYVVESKFPTDADPTWYRVYKSGWVEQGASNQISKTSVNTITFLKPFNDTNYNITGMAIDYAGGTQCVKYYHKTATSIGFYTSNNSSYASMQFNWQACGFMNQGV